MKVVIGSSTSEPPSNALHRVTASVWPQLKLLSNGVLVLASGRPGIGFWLAPTVNPDGALWIGYDVQVRAPCHVKLIVEFEHVLLLSIK